MELRRTSWAAAIRLATTLSVVAVVVAALLHTIGLSQPVIVLGVILVGFTTSWVRTGRVMGHDDRRHGHDHRHDHRHGHRVVTVPVRGVHFSR
jgi:uncharacterized membrane protein